MKFFELANSDEDTKRRNLWFLLCSIAKQSFVNDKGINNKDMSYSERWLDYTNFAESALRNYQITSHGSAVLRFFHVDDEGNPDWPRYLTDFWDGVFMKGDTVLFDWLKTENGLKITKKEREKLSHTMLVRA